MVLLWRCSASPTIQECIPVGCIPPAHWPYLVISHAGPHHICPQKHMPPTNIHTPLPPHTPPCHHTCPPPSRKPPTTMHAPTTTTHAPHHHTHPPATTHTTLPPCMPPLPPCTSPYGQNSWDTLLKTLPCPKLRLRVVKIGSDSCFKLVCKNVFEALVKHWT